MKKITFILVFVCFVISCTTEKKDVGLKYYSGFPIGTAIKIETLLRDSILQDLQKNNFNSITSASDMKMNRITTKEGYYNWEKIDEIVDYARTNNQRLFGHNLIWHSYTPNWVEEKAKEDSLWLDNFMRDYITTYVNRYKGKVAALDVVNEDLESYGGNIRKTMWYNVLGKDYIAKAFKYAHATDPNAILFYNDFNIERDTLKLNAALKLVNDLKEEGTPIHGIGF